MLSPDHQQVLDAILQRSATDQGFRRRLLTDPRAAIEQAFGVVIPRTFNIRFVEKDPGVDALVVLPDAIGAGGELSDSDLDSVSGGVEEARWDAE
jgi:hypothetical protein